MNRMLAAAAAVSSCSRPVQQEVVVIPGGPDASTFPATSDAGATTPLATATATATTPTTVTTPTVSTGYMVVDPMPSPARCLAAAAGMSGYASWKADATGPYVELIVSFTKPTRYSFLPTTPSSTDVMGAGLMLHRLVGSSIVVQVRPLAGNPSFAVSLEFDCGSNTGVVVAAAKLPPLPGKPGDILPVTVTDR